MNKKGKNKISIKINELREILNSFDLIPNSPIDEFDALNHQIISHLYKGSKKEKIHQIIKNELIEYYEIIYKDDDISEIIEKIFNWWNTK